MRDNHLKLDEVSFIGGATEFLVFALYDREGNVTDLDLTNSRVIWVLTNLGEKDSYLVKKDNKTIGGVTKLSVNEVKVELTKQDTINLLTGKYEHEIIIERTNGVLLRPCYGTILIRKGSEY